MIRFTVSFVLILASALTVTAADLNKVVRRSFLEGTAEFLSLAENDKQNAIQRLLSMEKRGPTKLDRCSASYALAFLTHPAMTHVSRIMSYKGQSTYTYIDEAIPGALQRLFVTKRNIEVLKLILSLRYDGAVGETWATLVSQLFLRFPNMVGRAVLDMKGSSGVRRWLSEKPSTDVLLWALVAHVDDEKTTRALLKRLEAASAPEAKVAASIASYILRHRDDQGA